MICFIILHYMVKEETIKCVESILEREMDNIQIIIVDNLSPNNSGQELFEYYKENDIVDVLLNDENAGFASGNNVGYSYTKEKYNPDFMIIMNNDVELASENFDEKLREVYKKEEFFILGPDIYSTTYELHQSPKRLEHYTYQEVLSLHNKFKKSKEITFSLKLKSWLKSNDFLRTFVYQSRVKSKDIDFTKIYYNVPLHGSCVIYSKLFIEKEEFAFQPGTFFYYETEILDYICYKKEYKTMYSPELKVLHHQNVSTNVVYNNMLKKTIFANKCNYESTGVFLKVMESFQENGVDQ
ncbi:TPA: glycosyltransferase family 2 protein [Streptococcus suis]|nr:glycosyltransferase family 2 protein [Streptococcus suis]